MAATVQSSAPQTNGSAGNTIAVDNPATGEVIGHVPDMDATQVEGLVARARAAQPAWSALGFKERARLLLELRAWIVRNRKRLIDALVRENGKTPEDALATEILYLGHNLTYWARHAERYLRDEAVHSGSPLMLGRKLKVRYEPYGVVGVIAPWNYPLNLGMGDSLAALAAGNTVVLKPSEMTPLSTLMLVEEGMREAGWPQDVCLVATGAGGAGAALVDNVDMVMFTGSTATGKKILKQAADRLVPVSAELGGKDPMIVLRDANLERAANVAVYWGLANSGQTCVSVERVYVEAPAYDEFVDKLRRKVEALRQGVPGEAGKLDVGAMTAPPQMEIVERHVREAVDAGARVLTGGKAGTGGGNGRFFEPTVLVDVDHSMSCMTEETFGPTLPVMKVRDADEAVRLANDTPYGLNACVFSGDRREGERIAQQVQSGGCGVNDTLTNYFALGAPFGGWKDSGLGARHGAVGIRKYCKTQTVLVNLFPLNKEIIHYPNVRWRTAVLDRLIVLMYGRGPRKRR